MENLKQGTPDRGRVFTTAKLNDVEPFAYLKDVLERMSAGHPMRQLYQLLPWNGTQQLSSTKTTCQKKTSTPAHNAESTGR
jgi:hypothetical protein